MTITNGYITLAEFKAFAVSRGQSASTDTADDAVIEALIESASRYIDKHSNRFFLKNSTAEVRYFVARRDERVFVGDLVSVSALYTDTAGGDRTYPTTWASTDYDLWPYDAATLTPAIPYRYIDIAPSGINKFPYGLAKGVKVSGIWGWPAVPDDIWEACATITQSAYALRSGQASNGKVTITSAGIVIRPEDVPAKAKDVIESYRILGF